MKYTLNRFNKIIIFLIFIITVISCSNDNDDDYNSITNATEKIQLLNVSYGSEALQKYDIYLPQNRSINATKVLILIHGGSWVSGDKNDLNSIVTNLQLKFPSYAIVNINYQLASFGKSPFPMQLNDIEKVLSHLKSNANNYHISSNFGFIGTSAGGHLAMLYTYDLDAFKEIKFVCSIVGPTNFTDENYISNPDYQQLIQGIQLIVGVNYEENPAYYKSISPYHVVTLAAPPSILFYGGKDNLVPNTQGLNLHEKLNELNVINEFTFYENEGHGWEGSALLDTYVKLEAFITTHF